MMFGRRHESLEREVKSLRDLVTALSQQFDAVNERAASDARRMSEIADRLKTLEARIGGDRLDGRLSGIDDRLGGADDRARRIERDLGTLAGRVQRLEHQAAIDAEAGRRAIGALLERIETKATAPSGDA